MKRQESAEYKLDFYDWENIASHKSYKERQNNTIIVLRILKVNGKTTKFNNF